MPSSKTDFPQTDIQPETDAEIWHRLREFFEVQLKDIQLVSHAEGHDKAESHHENQLKGFKNQDTWDEMFLQAFWRMPQSAETIEETRRAYFRFIAPLESPKEERLNQLTYMKRRLAGVLRRARKKDQNNSFCGTPEETETNLRAIFLKVESYQDLAHHCPEARELVQDIITIIGDLAALMKGKSE